MIQILDLRDNLWFYAVSFHSFWFVLGAKVCDCITMLAPNQLFQKRETGYELMLWSVSTVELVLLILSAFFFFFTHQCIVFEASMPLKYLQILLGFIFSESGGCRRETKVRTCRIINVQKWFSPPSVSYSGFFISTMKFLCATVWDKPQKCFGAGAGDVMDSWEWGFAGKPWVSDMDRLQVSMAKAHKQEETLRESRYFTARDHYKHPERGRKPLSMLK